MQPFEHLHDNLLRKLFQSHTLRSPMACVCRGVADGLRRRWLATPMTCVCKMCNDSITSIVQAGFKDEDRRDFSLPLSGFAIGLAMTLSGKRLISSHPLSGSANRHAVILSGRTLPITAPVNTVSRGLAHFIPAIWGPLLRFCGLQEVTVTKSDGSDSSICRRTDFFICQTVQTISFIDVQTCVFIYQMVQTFLSEDAVVGTTGHSSTEYYIQF